MDTNEGFNKLESKYKLDVINRFQAPLHKKITATAKRLRHDDTFDEDDALRYAIKKEETSWIEKLKNLIHQPIP